jgi:hypothetical protein
MKERFKEMAKQQQKQSASKSNDAEAKKTESETKATTGAGDVDPNQHQTGYSDANEPAEKEQEGFKGVGGAEDATEDPTEADADVKSEGKPEGVPEGRILEEGEAFEFEGEEVGNMVVVKEDVYRKVYPRGTKRPSYILLARKGSVQPKSGVQSV